MNSDAQTLATLAAKQEITEQLFNYSRSMDRIDSPLGKNVWHAGGTADYGSLFRGTGEEWIEFVSKVHAATTLVTSHLVSNILINVNFDKATSECHISAILQTEAEGKRIQRDIRGRYLDQWSYKDNRWAIDRRRYVHDLCDTREVVGEGFMFQPWGKRDTHDLSYDLDISAR